MHLPLLVILGFFTEAGFAIVRPADSEKALCRLTLTLASPPADGGEGRVREPGPASRASRLLEEIHSQTRSRGPTRNSPAVARSMEGPAMRKDALLALGALAVVILPLLPGTARSGGS